MPGRKALVEEPRRAGDARLVHPGFGDVRAVAGTQIVVAGARSDHQGSSG
ncbi:hypothetical protein AB0D33_07010 [Streptomyces sp. NPDC048404]